MRYRVDLTLNAKQSINVFRQTLRNDSDVPVTVSLTNITKNELVRNIDFLIRNSKSLIADGVMPEGANNVVDFKVYDNPKRIGSRRNITFSDSINKDDYLCKFIDSSETNTRDVSYLDLRHDVSMYLRYAGNPTVVLAQEAELISNIDDKEEIQEEVPNEKVQEEGKLPEELQIDNTEMISEEAQEDIVSKEVQNEVVALSEEVEEKAYFKGEDGKFYCPFEDCEKHKEGYATERAMKNHMLKVHKIEC